MSTWRIKSKSFKNIKDFRKPKKGELKNGDVYYWKCPYQKVITHTLIYSPTYSNYQQDISIQTREGLIYIKK